MLTGALVFLMIAFVLALYLGRATDPTFALIAKILIYFSVTIFFTLLIVDIVESAPPIYQTAQNLPI
jgi:lipopolysaccharide export LptBFGC system permease protein LptF